MQSQIPIPIERRALGTLAYIRRSIEIVRLHGGPRDGRGRHGQHRFARRAGRLGSPVGAALAVDLDVRRCHGILGRRGAHGARDRAPGHARYLGPVRKFLLCLCPTLFAGALLTGVLWHAGMIDLLPGTWLLLYGCAVLSASTVTIPSTMRLIAIMGALFVVLGSLAFLLPAPTHTFILGIGFGVLHIVFGILVGRLGRAY